jgi:hypothetical protein
VKKKIRQSAGRFEPSRAQCLFDTQKSLSERYLITFCFSRNFRSEKLFAESFGTREARKIEPWYELSFQNVYWERFSSRITKAQLH